MILVPEFTPFLLHLSSQAITYLQSSARLKGTEEITEEDIYEIAGVHTHIHTHTHTPSPLLNHFSTCNHPPSLPSLVPPTQIVPDTILDSLIKACYSDSYERLQSCIRVSVTCAVVTSESNNK